MKSNRRELLAGGLAVTAGACVAAPFFRPKYHEVRRPKRSRVAILHLCEYSPLLQEILMRGLKLFPLDITGRNIVLKPNLVDFIPGNAINTHPLLVASTAECFYRLGAKRVVVAEGPGHQRDTELVLAESGYAMVLRENGIRFVDLNRDHLVPVKLGASYSALKRLWLPRTVVEADFFVSMPKVKTHHWSGVTLSMKNMFGIVPGNKYGWPKNILHWHGIQQCVLDICATIPIHFVIADAITCMEGNGPLNGSPRQLNSIVLADDPVAADVTCARMMGLNPERIAHIREAGKFLGNSSSRFIEQGGEILRDPEAPFSVVPDFQFLQQDS